MVDKSIRMFTLTKSGKAKGTGIKIPKKVWSALRKDKSFMRINNAKLLKLGIRTKK